jgi:serine/threonine-protein kinase HipA
MLMFNFLVGNGDAHAKNFAILYEGKCAMLAPFYDLIYTILYALFAPKHKMAMKLPGAITFAVMSAVSTSRICMPLRDLGRILS